MAWTVTNGWLRNQLNRIFNLGTTPTSGQVLAYDSESGKFTPQAGGGGGITTPLDIPGCQLWLDASQIVGLADGDPVAQWNDLSGNGYNAAQAVVAKQPVFHTGVHPSIEFASTPDQTSLVVTAAPVCAQFQSADGFTLFVVGRLFPSEGVQTLLCASNPDLDQVFSLESLSTSILDPVTNASLRMFAGYFNGGMNYAGAFLGMPTADRASAIVTRLLPGRKNAVASSSNAEEYIGFTGDGNASILPTGLYIPSDASQYATSACVVHELGMFSRALTASEVRQLQEYLSAKWDTL